MARRDESKLSYEQKMEVAYGNYWEFVLKGREAKVNDHPGAYWSLGQTLAWKIGYEEAYGVPYNEYSGVR